MHCPFGNAFAAPSCLAGCWLRYKSPFCQWQPQAELAQVKLQEKAACAADILE